VAITAAVSSMLRGKMDVSEIISAATKVGLESIGSEATPDLCKEFAGFASCRRISDAELDDGPRIGYTLKAMAAAFAALRCASFEQAITEIAFQAGDADTNGAVAGALYGCHVGYRRLPIAWLEGLLHRQWLLDIAREFWKVMLL
jgi:ADP-ribosylglycohydrolase